MGPSRGMTGKITTKAQTSVMTMSQQQRRQFQGNHQKMRFLRWNHLKKSPNKMWVNCRRNRDMVHKKLKQLNQFQLA